MPTLTLAQAEALVVETLTRCRTEPSNAQSVARGLVAAAADGLKGHGLSRVPSYAAQSKVGKVDGFAKPKLTRPRPGLIAIDAANGFAYPAIEAAEAAPMLEERLHVLSPCGSKGIPSEPVAAVTCRIRARRRPELSRRAPRPRPAMRAGSRRRWRSPCPARA